MAGMRYTPRNVASYLRKVRKPLVERQRRERMNASIDRLKLLIADTIRQQVSPMTRVDKADILELTVFHLTRLQHQQRAVRVATEAKDAASCIASYQTGFRDCAREVVTYIAVNGACDPVVTTNMSGNLRSVYAQKQNSIRIPQVKNKEPCTYSHKGHNRQAVFMSTPRRSDERFSGLTNQITIPSMGTQDCSPISQMTKGHDAAIMHNSSTSGLSLDSSDSGFSNLDVSTDSQSFIRCESLGSDGCFSFDQSNDDAVGQVSKDNVWRP
ncbi:enhancer of split mgamma protein-like [Mya arenaria]|uniref:enhancer of split mgamma protein-like n=1 Tax=Mya arenaria TaxID=6604 RepID=UPI0022E05B2D|nr:enhancer of split mgamma protein-like [Mya arenaria]